MALNSLSICLEPRIGTIIRGSDPQANETKSNSKSETVHILQENWSIVSRMYLNAETITLQ